MIEKEGPCILLLGPFIACFPREAIEAYTAPYTYWIARSSACA